MIGRKKLSAIREELRTAFAAEKFNPLVELDQKIRRLKKSPTGAADELRMLETFRSALAQVVDEPKKPARSKRKRPVTKVV